MNGNPSQTLTAPAPNTHVSANTFRSIDLRSQDSKELETSTVVDVKPGLQDVRVTLG